MMPEREGTKIRILICDDEPNMVELLAHMMAPISSRIDETDNLEDCIKMAQKNQYHLIILDLRLGNTGKAEAIEAIRQLKAFKTGVVVVSGMPDPNVREEVLAAGADAFVPKGRTPLDRSLMIAAHVAVMHLPKDVDRSQTFDQHVQMLATMAAA